MGAHGGGIPRLSHKVDELFALFRERRGLTYLGAVAWLTGP